MTPYSSSPPSRNPPGNPAAPARRCGTVKAAVARLLVLWFASAPIVTVGSQGTSTGTQPTYAVTDLGSLGGSTIEAKGINNLGHVVGCGRVPSENTHAFLFTTAAGLVDLGTLGGNTSCATAINASGLVTGSATVSEFPNYRQGAFLYSPQTGMLELPSLGGDSVGAAINQLGHVVGTSLTNIPNPQNPGVFLARAFLYDGSGLTDLGTLGGLNSGATAINAIGQVAGNSDTAPGPGRAFLYLPNAGMIDLGALNGFQSSAYGMNDAGAVVGSLLVTTPQWIEERAFLYRASTGMVDIGNLGGSYGTARAINNRGEVVGDAITPDETAQHAIWYTAATGMVDLNSLIPVNSGWELQVATAINDLGQIAGSGRHNGQRRAFLLTPAGGGLLPPPTALTARQSGIVGAEISLHWTFAADTPVDGFEIDSKMQGGTWAPLASVSATTRTYTDVGVPPYATVSYRIRATFQGARSPHSGIATAFQLRLLTKNCGINGIGPCSALRDWPAGRAQDNSLVALFEPNPFDQTPTLATVAADHGFDHFNWFSVVMHLPSSATPILDWQGNPVATPPPFVDPPPGGYGYHPADPLPYYWDEQSGFVTGYHLQDNVFPQARPTQLIFEDHPYNPTLAHSDYIQFVTSLVGVRAAPGSPSTSTALNTVVWSTNNRLGTTAVLTNLESQSSGGTPDGGLISATVATLDELPASVRNALASGGVQGLPTSPKIDLDAPHTAAYLAGVRGNAGWHRGPVTVSLIASDFDGPADVGATHYELDGVATTDYSGLLTISEDGVHRLRYRSVDISGNAEDFSSMDVIRIDSQAPVLTCAAKPTTLWPPNGRDRLVTITGAATDTLSGLGSTNVAYELLDEYGERTTGGSTATRNAGSFAFTVSLPAWRRGNDLDGRQFQVVTHTVDTAGNRGVCSTTVTVPHDQRQ